MDSLPLIGITAHYSPRPSLPLHGLRPAYTQVVNVAGGAPLIIPSNLDRPGARAIFERVDGLILSGGVDVAPALYGQRPQPYTQHVDPDRDQIETWLVRWACAEEKPLLAICRGVQILNVALGGTLYQDVQAEMPGGLRHAYYDPEENWPRDHLAHTVQIERGSRLKAILAPSDDVSLPVNSLHHQGIKEIATGLIPTAHAPDRLVEALELVAHPFMVGVQWHPEELAPNDPTMLRLFQALVEGAQTSR